MKLKFLFLGGMLALSMMSFSSNDKEESLGSEATESTCSGNRLACVASPNRYKTGY